MISEKVQLFFELNGTYPPYPPYPLLRFILCPLLSHPLPGVFC